MSDDQSATVELGTKAMFEIVWAMMREYEIPTIRVEFSGEGDSGDITDTSVSLPYPEVAGLSRDEAAERYQAWNKRQSVLNEYLEERTGCVLARENCLPPDQARNYKLHELVDHLTEPLLQWPEHDWVNNDGGYGTVTWTLDGGDGQPEITIELHERVVSTDDFEFTYDRHGEEVE